MKWQEPPDPMRAVRGVGSVQRDIAELRKQPGVWALVREDVSHASARNWQQQGAQTVVRRHPGGKYDLYARWPADGAADD